MTGQATKTSRPLGTLEKVFVQLKLRMRELGLNLSAWDGDGEAIEPLAPTCEFCRTICAADGGCQEFSRGLATRVFEHAEAAGDRTALGCCVLGVPAYQRRRLLAAAVACFPTFEMLDEESFAQLCDHLRLDCRIVRNLADQAIRHNAKDIDDFLRMLTWLQEREQSRLVANDELATLSANLASTYEELSLLYRVSGSMRITQQPSEFLQNVCNELLEVMNIEAAMAVVSAHPPATEEDLVVTAGQLGLDEEQVKDLATTNIAPKFVLDHRAILDNDFSSSRAVRFSAKIKNLVAVPLVTDEDSIGVLIGLNKLKEDFDSVDLKLISAIGSQAAVFLANSRLYADLQDLLMGVLHALTASIDAKDPYTSGHSQRVALISRHLAEECNFRPEKVQQLYLAGLLHDIGKIGVSEAILCKEGKLTEEEYDDIKRHPLLGARILGGIRQLDDVIAAILYHHERPDGKGYPEGLKGEEVPIEGLIIGLADGLDAMTSDRTYRAALPIDAAIEEIRQHAGTQFDAGLVERLLSLDLGEFMAEIHEPAKTVFPFKFREEPQQ